MLQIFETKPNTYATYHPAPDLTAIDLANLQPSTKLQYRKAISNMIMAGIDPQDHDALRDYASTLKSSSRQFLKSALRLMTEGVRQTILANSDGSSHVIASLHRLDAMQNAITVPTHKGEKAHLWLSRQQVTDITALCENSQEGRRDWIVLGLLLGAGLRREELSELTFSALKSQPTRNGQPRYVLEVTGKGAKDRVIPISQTLARHLLDWQKAVGGSGCVARALTRGRLQDSLSPIGIFKIVAKYGALIGLPELAPHDLRRTYAQLSYEAGVPVTQISRLLGHADIRTTQKYLSLDLNLESTASDFIPLSGD